MNPNTRVSNAEIDQLLSAINTPGIPWGKVLGYSWSTDRWHDYPVPLWKAIARWLGGKEWRRTEFRLVTPADKEWNLVPYKVTHIL